MGSDTKPVHGTCEICPIPCECTQCNTTIDKPWTPVVPPNQQPRSQPIKYFTYWPVLGYFNNYNIIQFSHKKFSEDVEKIIRSC